MLEDIVRRIKGLGGSRGDYVVNAVDTLDTPVHSLLDIGCSYGWTLDALTGKALELVGVDTDEGALQQAKNNYTHIKFIHQNASTLPFESNTFDVAVLSEVIEHVGDENKQLVIDEAHRVLRTGGLFILTCPHTGLLAWVDPLDFKRRFPRIYRVYMRLTNYEPHTPIEVGHKHLSLKEIESLFNNRFKIKHVRYCGFFEPLLTWILAVDSRVKLLPSTWHSGLNRLRAWESGVPYGKSLAYNIRVTSFKKKNPQVKPRC